MELPADASRYQAIAEALAVVLWRSDANGQLVSADGWTALTGQPSADALGRGWLQRVHPDDVPRIVPLKMESLRSRRPIDVEYRVRTAAGDWRWCRSRGVPLSGGANPTAPMEWVGAVEDIHDRRQAEEARQIVVREIDHRTKNVLAVVQSIVRMSKAATQESYSSIVAARISALSNAHTLLSENGWIGCTLQEIVERELAPELRPPGATTLTGPEIYITPIAVQPLTMIFHELVTNTAKAGALSVPEGVLTLSWSASPTTVHISWAETGGPSIKAAPARPGFGGRVIDATVRGQLGGTITRIWGEGGLTCQIDIPRARIQTEGTLSRSPT